MITTKPTCNYHKHYCYTGSTINLKTNTNYKCVTWTLNESRVRSECETQIEFIKKNPTFCDSGIYKCIVGGHAIDVFNVIVYDFLDFEIGSTININVGSTPWYYDTIWICNGRMVSPIFYPHNDLKIKEANFRDSGTYTCKMNGKERCVVGVCVKGTYECRFGSTIHLKWTTDLVSPTWTLNGKSVSSECDPLTGFEKKNAHFNDSGIYRCTVKKEVVSVFDVIVYGTYECRFGSTIHLKWTTYIGWTADLVSSTWTLNGKSVSSECDPLRGFEKKNAHFNDSGIYRCTVKKKLLCLFDVIVYEYLFEDEFLGVRIKIPGTSSEKKLEILSKSEHKEIIKELEAFTHLLSLAKSERKQHLKEVEGYAYQMKASGDKSDMKSKDYPMQNRKRIIRHRGWVTTTPNRTGIMTKSLTWGTETAKSCEVSSSAGRMTIPEYNMNRNPRGLAVIISIGEFDRLSSLSEMTRADAERCRDTFEYFHFTIRKPENNTEHGIVTFLEQVAAEDHDNFDCFLVYVTSHGGNGFFCCSDFERGDPANPAKGFIYFDQLLDTFLHVDSLTDKPKLFFIDCCRNQGDIGEWMNQAPIRLLTPAGMQLIYANILLGYAAIVGAYSEGDQYGSYYTKILTRCLQDLADQYSITDVMTAVTKCMAEDHESVSDCHSTLTRILKMRILPAL